VLSLIQIKEAARIAGMNGTRRCVVLEGGQMPETSRFAACVVFASLAFVGGSFASDLDIEAYGIGNKPRPGPVTELQPIKQLPPVPFELPFEWDMDPFGDRTWQTRLHMLRSLVDGALAAGDFKWPSKVFRDWQRWHKDGRKAPRSDTGTAARAARLAYVLHFTGWKDRSLVELAEQHAEELQDPDFIQDDHNHGIGQLHGLAALCLDRKLRACSGAEALLERTLPVLLRSQFTQGVHRENSPGYHFYALDKLLTFAPILESYAPDYGEILWRAERKTKWLVHPDKTIVAVGDTSPVRADVRLPRGDAECDGIRAYSEAPECYMLKHFKKVGYVVARSDWAIPAEEASMLFVQGGFFNESHRQPDDFSFEWFEQGSKILSDGGKYAYTDDKWRRYFNSTRAHNTIEVDGRNYSTEQEDAYGNAVREAQQTSKGMRVIMQIDHHDLQVWHRRQIDYLPGEVLRIKDSVRSDRSRVYIQWHHAARDFELSGDDGRFELDDGEMLVELETITSCGRGTKYAKIKGQREPQIQGWASVENRERHERWSLGVECRARNATFVARFEIQ
jgi:Heparinase II/III-like protein